MSSEADQAMDQLAVERWVGEGGCDRHTASSDRAHRNATWPVRRVPREVVIAGAGIAALELALGLDALAQTRVNLTLVAPEPEFTYRPPALGYPLTLADKRRYRLRRVADDLGARLIHSGVGAVRPERHELTTTSGAAVRYDTLIVAVGAIPVPPFAGVITVGAQDAFDALTALNVELEAGSVRSVAFVVPTGTSWTLPLYELAIMTARHCWTIGLDRIRFWFITPEPEPLAIFGPQAARVLHDLLEPEGITFLGASFATVREGAILIDARAEPIEVDRIVCLPRLEGPKIPGLPCDADGFIPVGADGRVASVADVYAAGDATVGPIKHGGLACQQSDAIAERVAAAAGARVVPAPYEPVLRGKLMTGGHDRYFTSDLAHPGGTCPVSDHALWWPPTKVAGRYLSPYLVGLDATELDAVSGAAAHVPVELSPDDVT